MHDTVVVVGCGPAGQSSGKEIDRHPVVRMWNHEWQPADRFGSRYDYGMITARESALIAAKRPKKGWFFYNVPHEDEVSKIEDVPVIVLDHMRWYRHPAAQGAKPGGPKALKFSRGFAAVAGVIEHLRPKRILAIAMDVLCNGVTSAKYYDEAALPYYVKSYPNLAKISPAWAADEIPAGRVRNGPHDFQMEANLIRALAAEAGVELVWSRP